MAYLEKLLPEFRKGAKIRSSMWSKKAFIHLKDGKILDESGLPYTIPAIAFHINDWELYQGPIDWDYIVKSKCLCWFWDHSEERKKTGLLARLISQDEYRFEKGGYNGEPSIPYMNCRPVRKDEVNFYE